MDAEVIGEAHFLLLAHSELPGPSHARTKKDSKHMDPIEQCKNLNTYIGERIRLRRKQKLMSQTELGDAVELTFQQIQKYEAGNNRISAARLLLVAKALGVPVTYFFEGHPQFEEENSEINDDAALLSMIQRLPTQTKSNLRNVICDLLQVAL